MTLVRSLHIVTLVGLLAMPGPVHAAPSGVSFDSLAGMDFARDTVSFNDLRPLSPDDLFHLRGIVFGRHGRVFRDDRIQEWLEEQPWYRPDSTFTNRALDPTERLNLDRIRQLEAESHDRIMPGDLRWWQAREMTIDALGDHSPAEWAVLRAEVEAVHGKRFAREPWLRRYFDERYWYAPDDAYDTGRLTPIEARNLALIDSLGRGSDASAVHACDMGLFEQRLITPEDLQGAGFMLLRILRNEVYARHGLTFGEQGLQMHFGFTSWYVQRPGQPVVLSAIEQRNVATISAHERTLRDSLRTRPLDPALLEGLYAEDARRLRLEIYARHGRVFRRRWEQDYVASRPGYRPDLGYSEAMLADVERANIAAIVAYEKTAASVMDAVEG